MAIYVETYNVWKTNQSKLSMKSFLDSNNAKSKNRSIILSD